MPPVSDVQADMPFPLAGVNVATEYGLQPDRTTPRGNNVRAMDQIAERLRGGSRPGLTRYPDDQLPGEVQNLLAIATTDYDHTALVQDPYYTAANSSYVFDPSTNNRANGDAGRPGPDGEWGGPPGGGVGYDPDNPGGFNTHRGSPGAQPAFDRLIRNRGRRVRNGGSGVMPIRDRPERLPDGTDVPPGASYRSAKLIAYRPDLIPYVYQFRFTDTQTIGYGLGVGTSPADVYASSVNKTFLVQTTGGSTADGFGVVAGLPVVTPRGF